MKERGRVGGGISRHNRIYCGHHRITKLIYFNHKKSLSGSKHERFAQKHNEFQKLVFIPFHFNSTLTEMSTA